MQHGGTVVDSAISGIQLEKEHISVSGRSPSTCRGCSLPITPMTRHRFARYWQPGLVVMPDAPWRQNVICAKEPSTPERLDVRLYVKEINALALCAPLLGRRRASHCPGDSNDLVMLTEISMKRLPDLEKPHSVLLTRDVSCIARKHTGP